MGAVPAGQFANPLDAVSPRSATRSVAPKSRPRSVRSVPADPGLTLLVYTAEPGSPTQDALNLLGSWATTPHQPETIRTKTET